jgi:tetratricopeptide (TPR) repeat protein
MKPFFQVGALAPFLVLLLSGCARVSQSLYLSGYEREINRATGAIEAAGNHMERAAAYSRRGSAYSEKARYSRSFKLISTTEYERWFTLATQDHDRALTLHPGGAELYFGRGQTYYDRAALENASDARPWFNLAAADFKKSVEANPRYALAWDRLGMVHEQTGDLDEAINDYTREMALDPLGRMRLADVYCRRGSERQRRQENDAAIADFEKSIEIGASADGCSCDPYNPLVGIYDGASRYDQAWEVVRKARSSRRSIAPELIAELRKHSGRNE